MDLALTCFDRLPVFLFLRLPQLRDLSTKVRVRNGEHQLCRKLAVDFTLVRLHTQLSEELLLGGFDGVVVLLAVRGDFSDVLSRLEVEGRLVDCEVHVRLICAHLQKLVC